MVLSSLFFATNALAELPNGFVYVSDIDPTIIQCLRYYTNENFIGAPIDGYKGKRAILSREAAEALAKVQKELLAEGYSLVIYDSYRPQKAVDHFVRWGKDINESKMKEKYYPRIDKAHVFTTGYVAEKSGHSRGSTVDLTIIPKDKQLKSIEEITASKRQLKDGFNVVFLDDATVDMGSSFDLFDIASHHNSPVIAAEPTKLRNYLRGKMEKYGFEAYPQEWWHYTLKNEPYPTTYFDFDVQ